MSSDKVAQNLVQRIESGAVTAGQYLPTTRELAAQYGVTLHAVGTALRQLEAMSLVERRPRQGTVVLQSRREGALPVASQVRQVAMLVGGTDATWAAESGPAGQWSHCIAQAFEKEMFDAGYSVSIMPLRRVGQEGPTLVQRLERMGEALHGAIALFHAGVVEAIPLFRERDIPLVTINRPAHGIDYNYVAADNTEAGWRVGRLFHAASIHRIMLVTTVAPYALSSGEKMAGFMQSCFELGLPMDRIRVAYVNQTDVNQADAREQAGDLTRQALAEGFVPQGVFAAGDVIAAGVIDALTRHGLRVPDDVGVISSTGVASTGPCDIPLSCVSQPMEAIGQSAGQMLLAMMREGTCRYLGRRIPCSIVLRESFQLSEAARANLSMEPDALWSNQIRECPAAGRLAAEDS